MEYYKTGNQEYFERAVNEVKLNSSYSSNPATRIGLQNRNDIRAIILDSRKCPLYSNPRDELIPENKRIQVVVGKTIITKEVSRRLPESSNLGGYYIWRTRNDDKVRSSHQEFEGKVFSHEANMVHPGDEYGCRCWRQQLPINAFIKEDKNRHVNDNVKEYGQSPVIIRKHITDLNEITGSYYR